MPRTLTDSESEVWSIIIPFISIWVASYLIHSYAVPPKQKLAHPKPKLDRLEQTFSLILPCRPKTHTPMASDVSNSDAQIVNPRFQTSYVFLPRRPRNQCGCFDWGVDQRAGINE